MSDRPGDQAEDHQSDPHTEADEQTLPEFSHCHDPYTSGRPWMSAPDGTTWPHRAFRVAGPDVIPPHGAHANSSCVPGLVDRYVSPVSNRPMTFCASPFLRDMATTPPTWAMDTPDPVVGAVPPRALDCVPYPGHEIDMSSYSVVSSVSYRGTPSTRNRIRDPHPPLAPDPVAVRTPLASRSSPMMVDRYPPSRGSCTFSEPADPI